jgi:hypothetical protein
MGAPLSMQQNSLGTQSMGALAGALAAAAAAAVAMGTTARSAFASVRLSEQAHVACLVHAD